MDIDIKNVVVDEGLTFEEGEHTYWLCGSQIPSVTTVMRPLSDKYYDRIDKHALEVAANRGTAVHNAIEVYNEFGILDIPEEFKGYMDAYMKWVEDRHPAIYRSEIRTYHKILMYAGTADLICGIDGDTVLVDYKTSYRVSEMLYGVQLEAYAQALKSHGLNVGKKIILHLKNDGTYKEYVFPAADSRRWRVFNSLMDIYRYLEDERK